MTPYKGSMLGGTLVGGEGEESAAPITIVPNLDLNQNGLSSHFMYFSEIAMVYSVAESLIIVKKNQDIEKFNFIDEAQMKTCLGHLRNNYKEVFKFPLTYYNFGVFEKD